MAEGLKTDNDLKINVTKTEHLSTRENPLPIKLNGEELKNVDHFKYLGSEIDKDGTIDRDVDLRVRAAWSSWRKLTGVLYDRKIPLRLKAKVYEAIIRPAMTYGSECWAMKVTNKRKFAKTEMRMLRGILGVSRREHMRNEDIRRILHVSPIDEVMRGGRLRWFGHVCPETRGQQRHPQSDEPGNTRCQTTKTPQEDMAPTTQGRHDGRRCYQGCGPRPKRMEAKDTADP